LKMINYIMLSLSQDAQRKIRGISICKSHPGLG